ncbi:PREDICTED: glucan endo-1,3-beta-glucosidase 8-like [Nicotiana attenuata]|uniref:Glucan endo-1,3-beta-glucosidase 8 n=1 Tax=Nicotiana attenuata TaxID=49451 RepID=A0A314L488_NICAT|nr:PREDICTED: glucan endo-1,3-beta-glucosidase 8-like [Nicotiana attenuata]OIT36420.1 glucan endo-1,3-beta-glucosidase 8 [Nicotiana attenuata]
MYKNTGSLWISLFMSLMFLSLGGIQVDAFVGINWGRMAKQRFVPSMVVDLLLQNGITELRIFQPSLNVLDAFADTNIGMTITLQENYLRNVREQKEIDVMIHERVKNFVDKGVKFRYVYVGNEPFTKSKYSKAPFSRILHFLNLTRNSLDKYNLQDIKVTTPIFTDVLINMTKPSEGEFREEIKGQMKEFLDFLNKMGSPFVINIFPIYTVYNLGFDVEFAFFDSVKSNFKVVDGNNTYYNLFTFLYDALVCALTKAGYGDIEIVIGQIGWPTDGYEGASEENAERFHRGFLKYLGRKEGTPLRPNKDINVFLLSLTDENMVATDLGNYQRHWGIYKLDGEPKYKIDFTMHDLNTKPTVAKGTVKMPNRWCVFDGKTDHNETLLMKDFDSACMDSDCSTFGSGATCDHLVFAEKVSYAYNMRYQMNNQDQEYCELIGAVLTANNPSTPDCEFPVEILTAEVVDGGSPDTKKY